jgi:glycerol uptake facilitator-like aquaporin
MIANHAVTIGRIFCDTFAGIAPGSAPGFIAAQILGALLGLGLIAVLYPQVARITDDVVVPHHNTKPIVDQWSSS